MGRELPIFWFLCAGAKFGEIRRASSLTGTTTRTRGRYLDGDTGTGLFSRSRYLDGETHLAPEYGPKVISRRSPHSLFRSKEERDAS